ncbi:MAG: FAD-dependent oxidoreductase, partial [Ginsengibacter sp.]
AKSKAVNPHQLIGGLYSPVEMVVDPREAIATVAIYLHEQLNVKFIWNSKATRVRSNKVFFDSRSLEADVVCICSGADFETLYPDHFKQLEITKCKLQMMRFKSKAENFNLGPSLCGGLSLIHYKGFTAAPSLAALQKRYYNEMPCYIKNGIHVMVSQNGQGELTVGDSHRYGLSLDPFDDAKINALITSYLSQFVTSSNWQLLQTWNGIYPKMLNGATDIFIQPEDGVYILNGLGGAGMTLSFGFAEEMVENI